MNTVKFRGRRNDGVWLYGYYFKYEDTHNIVPDSYSSKPTEYFHVDPKTISQFIGLIDKNGKEVYDGDILSDGKGSIGEVKYITRIAQFCIISDNFLWSFNEGNPSRSTKLEYTEIVGNIHDNR